MAKEPFGIICSPWATRSELFGFEMAKGSCCVCEVDVAYDVESLEQVKKLAAKEGTVYEFVCENCAAHQMSTASDEEMQAIRQRFRDMGNPKLAFMLEMFSNDELREFFAKLKRPVQ